MSFSDQNFRDEITKRSAKSLEAEFARMREPTLKDFDIPENKAAKAIRAYNSYITWSPTRQRFARSLGLGNWLLAFGFVFGLWYVDEVYPHRVDIVFVGAAALLASFLVWKHLSEGSVLAGRYERYINAKKRYGARANELSQAREAVEELERKEKIKATQAEYWFSLTGHEFEERISSLLQAHYSNSVVRKTKGSGDGGIDLIIVDGDDKKTVVQCKAHKKAVGPHVVRDLFGAMHDARAAHGLLVSLGGVTQGVDAFIQDKPISVLTLDHILEMQRALVRSDQEIENGSNNRSRKKKRRSMPKALRDDTN